MSAFDDVASEAIREDMFPPHRRTLLDELRLLKSQEAHHFTCTKDGRRLLVLTAHGRFEIDLDTEVRKSGQLNYEATDILRVFGDLLEVEVREWKAKADRLDSANINLESQMGVAKRELATKRERVEELEVRVRRLEVYAKGLNTRVRNLKAKGAK